MRLDALIENFPAKKSGREMYALAERLFPICRSITGNGVRETLQILGEAIPLNHFEVATGTAVFDWTVPKEWTIRDGWIKNSQGEKIVDFFKSNLHIMGYSLPIRMHLSLSELQAHLYSLPDKPTTIPFRSSFYQEAWGFCLSHDQRQQLPEDEYEVCIDASLEDGHLSYAECVLPGSSSDEVIVFAHVCHPSLANDNLSGIAVAWQVAHWLGKAKRRYTYRIVFAPTVIGSITWLHQNQENAGKIKHGLTLALLGDKGGMTYKKSRIGNAGIDQAVAHVLKHSGEPYTLNSFTPYGYDERQFCSPGFNLAMGCLMRSPNGTFPEYHTSEDNLSFIQPDALSRSLLTCLKVLAVLETNETYLNLNPKCEPRLGKRGVYEGLQGKPSLGEDELALLWVLNYSDGNNSVLDIAERAGYAFATVRRAADVLEKCELLALANGRQLEGGI